MTPKTASASTLTGRIKTRDKTECQKRNYCWLQSTLSHITSLSTQLASDYRATALRGHRLTWGDELIMMQRQADTAWPQSHHIRTCTVDILWPRRTTVGGREAVWHTAVYLLHWQCRKDWHYMYVSVIFSGGASAGKEPGHFEVRTSSTQVIRMHFFLH